MNKLYTQIVKEKCKDIGVAYKVLIILFITQSAYIFIASLGTGLENVKGAGAYTMGILKSPIMLKIAIVVETIYGLLYIVPIAIAFVHDLLYEQKPKYLLVMFILELGIFMLLKFVEMLGYNIIFLILGIGVLIWFSTFSFIVIDAFGFIVEAGLALYLPLLYIGIPILTICFLIECIMEMFA